MNHLLKTLGSATLFAAFAKTGMAREPSVTCHPPADYSPPGQSLLDNRLGKKGAFEFPSFSQKIDVLITLPEARWVGRVSLLSSLPPERNIDRADIAIKEEDANFIEVAQISGLGEGSGTTQVSLPLKRKAQAIRITLRPPFIEVPISLHSIGLELFEEPPKEWSESDEEKHRDGSVVLAAVSSPSFFFKDFQFAKPTPLREVGCDLRIEDGGENGEWNLLLQAKEGTVCRVGIKQYDDKFFAVVYDGTKAIRLSEVPTNRRISLKLKINPGKQTYVYTVDGVDYDKEDTGWPLAGATVNRILFSVPKGGGIHRLDNVIADFGTPRIFKFDDANEFASWNASGQTEWTAPEFDVSATDQSRWISLANEGIEVKLDGASGEIMHVIHRNSEVRLIDGIISSTMVQTLKGDQVVEGIQDKVIKVGEQGKDHIQFLCRFAGLPGVLVTKKYRLSGNRVFKTVTYEREDDTPPDSREFITPTERIYLPKNRLKNLSFSGGDPWYSPRIFAESIKTKSRQRGAGNSHGVVIMDRSGDTASVSLVRYMVNDRFVWPLTSAYHHESYNVMNYFPDGVQVPMTTLSLNNREQAGYEAVIDIFEGDELDFAKNYRSLPLVEAEYARINRPTWLKDVICQIWLRPEVKDEAVAYLKQLIEMTDKGDIMVVLNQPFIWGDFGEGPRFQNIWGGWIEDSEYIRLLAELKALSPRVKVALYTWIWTVAPESDIYRNHPEYFIRTDKSGEIFKAWPGLEMSHLRKMNHPEGFKALADQYRHFVEKYDIDYVYLDGGMGGSNLIDWKVGNIDQEYHWQDFYEYMRKLAMEKNGGGLSFNNKNNPIADSGISEMALDAFRTDAKYVISRIWGGKLQEAFDPEHRIIPCYWGHSDPWYTNVCLGLGMLPHIEYAGLSRIEPDFIIKKAPLLAAIHEMSQAKPVAVLPGSLLDKADSDVIGFELERGGTRALPLILIADQPEKRTFTLPERNWESGQPLYVWLNHLTDPDKIRSLTEKQMADAYQQAGWMLSDVIAPEFSGTYRPGEPLEFSLRPKLLTLAALSNSRAVVLAVDGSPTQSRFADTLGIHVETQDQPDAIAVDIKAPANLSTFDIALALPNNLSILGIDGAEFRGAFVSGKTPFLVMRCKTGEARVRLGTSLSPHTRTVEIASKVETGTAVAYQIDGKDLPANMAFNFRKNGRLVAIIPVNAPSGKIHLPEYALNGGYELQLIEAGSTTPVWSGHLELQASRIPPLPAASLSEATPESRTQKVDHPKVKAIGLGGGQNEMADLEKMRLVAGNHERPASFHGYSCAGFEFGDVHTLTLKITSDLATRYHIENQFRKNAFAGLIVDYKVGEVYVKRVAFGLGVNGYASPMPSYGAHGQPTEVVEAANWIREQTSGTLTLNLEQWAPPGWTGQCFVSAMIANLLPGRTMTIDVESGD